MIAPSYPTLTRRSGQSFARHLNPPLKAKLDAFLATTDAGDKRHAKFGLELQRLLLNASINDILKRVFLCSLKPTIVTAITGSLSVDFEKVVAAADKAWTAASASTYDPATVSAISGRLTSSTRGSGRGRRSGRGGRQRGSRSSCQIESLALCHFHKKFGDSARKCAQGCSRWSENRPLEASTPQVFHMEETLDGEDSLIGTASENA